MTEVNTDWRTATSSKIDKEYVQRKEEAQAQLDRAHEEVRRSEEAHVAFLEEMNKRSLESQAEREEKATLAAIQTMIDNCMLTTGRSFPFSVNKKEDTSINIRIDPVKDMDFSAIEKHTFSRFYGTNTGRTTSKPHVMIKKGTNQRKVVESMINYCREKGDWGSTNEFREWVSMVIGENW